MKKLFLFTILSIFNHSSHAQQWEWARQAQSNNDHQCPVSVIVDRNNNFVYSLGVNKGTATYGNFSIDSGCFVAKYTLQGNLVWAKELPATARALACDQTGNLYIAGTFSTSISQGNTVLTSIGGKDIYLLKLNSSGTLVNLRRFGGPWDDNVSAIKMSQTDELFIAGDYDRSISFDNKSLASVLQARVMYLAKLGAQNSVEWVRTCPQNAIDSTSYCNANLLAVDKQGSAYVFGQLQFPAPPCQMYCYGFYLTKYSSSGNLVLDKPVFGIYSYATGLTIDDSLNIIMIQHCGSHYTSCKELVKYDQQLKEKWSTGLGSYGYGPIGYLGGLSVDKACNIYLAGMVGEMGDNADTISDCNTYHYTGGAADVMIGQFDAGGKCRWTLNAPGKGQEWIYAGPVMDLDNVGNCYLGGACGTGVWSSTIAGQAVFGPDTINGSGSWDHAFLAKLANPNPVTVTVKDPSGILTSLTVYPNPNTGQFYLKGLPTEQNCKINCIDVYGRTLLATEVEDQDIKIEGLNPGIYFLQVSTNSSQRTLKVEIAGN